jgi:23S rRNA (adenine2503-C2)-methyltransferase
MRRRQKHLSYQGHSQQKHASVGSDRQLGNGGARKDGAQARTVRSKLAFVDCLVGRCTSLVRRSLRQSAPAMPSHTAPVALQALLPSELAALSGIDASDARRLVGLVHRTGALPARAPATVRRTALDAARRIGHVPQLELVSRRASAVDPFVKYAFRLDGGGVIESVRIPLERAGRFAACVSSQVGCALACAFCATGRMGLSRNLEAWEIVEQVRALRADLPEGGRIHGVVFQGMGEPLANADRVIQAIRVLGEPSAQAIDMRNVTVCTAGLPAGIRRLAREVPAVRLGVSIGSARAGARAALMPIDGAHALAEVLAACGDHARATRQSPMWAYTLLAGHNDADEDAAALAELALAFAAEHGVRPRLSLVPYNEIAVGSDANAPPSSLGDEPFARSAPARLAAFRAVLSARGLGSIVRYSGGADIGAACGQLARRQ